MESRIDLNEVQAAGKIHKKWQRELVCRIGFQIPDPAGLVLSC
jgi:hypothetical protein